MGLGAVLKARQLGAGSKRTKKLWREYVGLLRKDHDADVERVIEMAREQSRDAAEIAAVLLIVQGLGEQVTRPDGAIARRYELTVDGAGAVRLNGNDLGPLLRSLQGRPR